VLVLFCFSVTYVFLFPVNGNGVERYLKNGVDFALSTFGTYSVTIAEFIYVQVDFHQESGTIS
jgi:hypothetical protein